MKFNHDKKHRSEEDDNMALGICFGLLFGLLLDNLALGLCLGVVFGAVTGKGKKK